MPQVLRVERARSLLVGLEALRSRTGYHAPYVVEATLHILGKFLISKLPGKAGLFNVERAQDLFYLQLPYV